MTTFQVFIKCETEAFGEEAGGRAVEVAEILRRTAADILAFDQLPESGRVLLDRNGNKVGLARFIDMKEV